EKKSADNLLRAIENSKKPLLAKFIYALGIRHVGEHVADLLASHFGTLDDLQSAGMEDLVYNEKEGRGIKGIGHEIAGSIVAFFENEANKGIIQRLLKAGIRFERIETAPPSPVRGKTFVLTGSLGRMTRSEAKEKIIARGGRLASGVGRGTDYLVAGESPGTKLQKAETLGVKILQEMDFLALLGEDDGQVQGSSYY
ncbi:MAG: helix-hairpin-helix domain-containing protein, partial [Pseudomonadota bacterium]